MAFHPGSGRTRHEIVGRVTAGGGGVAKFKVGDTVGVGCLVDSCRTRPKGRTGLEPSCDNGLVMSDGRTETRRGGRSDRAARRGRSSGRGGRGAERQPPATVRLAVRNRQPGRLRAGGGGGGIVPRGQTTVEANGFKVQRVGFDRMRRDRNSGDGWPPLRLGHGLRRENWARN